MTISSTVNKIKQEGNGTATSFSFNFVLDNPGIANDEHLEVTITDSNGVNTVLSEGTGASDYSVTLTGDYPSDGSVTYPASGATRLQTGEFITIKRKLPLLQGLDLNNQGGFFADLHEEAFDEGIMIDQQQQEEIDRSLKFPVEDTASVELPSATSRASKYLAFDASGNAIAALNSPTDVVVSSFGETLVDDANASAALTTLGFSSYGKTLIDDASALVAKQTLRTLHSTIEPVVGANLTVDASDDGRIFFIDTSGANRTVLLPAAATAGAGFKVTFYKNSVTDLISIDADGSETIDGWLQFNLGAYKDTVTLLTDGSNWFAVDGRILPLTTVKTAPGSSTHTFRVGMRYALVTMVGGGGGGGGTQATGGSEVAESAGGGGGEYKQALFRIASTTADVTVGAAGAAASAGLNNGGTGGTSSFGTTLLSAVGGSGGVAGSATSTSSTSAGGAGGTGGTVDASAIWSVSVPGQNGFDSRVVATASRLLQAQGGASKLGFGGAHSEAGKNYGGGGGGENAGNSTGGQVGLAGAQGIVIIQEFY